MMAGVQHAGDDRVLPFAVEGLEVRGRVVSLGPTLDTILARHSYPAPVARVLGEAAALTVLLGSSLKFDGRFQLQTRSDGPIDLIVVDFDAPDKLRACARFDARRLAQAAAERRLDTGALIGHGHLALTIDQGPDMSRYQGVVALEGQNFEEAAHLYFRQSEQIPTRVRLAVGEELTGERASYRAGGLMVQFLPPSPERQRQPDLPPGDAPQGHVHAEAPEDDSWVEAKLLAETVEDHELIDPTVTSERLLYRLFHERGVRVFNAQGVREQCRCSRDRIMAMMLRFSLQERRDMVGDDGRIGITCEFCSRFYDLDPAEVEAAIGA
jgi:molecular chaperone Hsp33